VLVVNLFVICSLGQESLCPDPSKTPIPKHWNWAEITPPTNQGTLGSSSIIAALETLDDGYTVKTGKLAPLLSAQQLIDCVGEDVPPPVYLEYLAQNGGADTLASYPFTGIKGTCKSATAQIGVHISKYTVVDRANETELACAVWLHQPVAVCVDSSHINFEYYTGGIYYEPGCGTSKLDHCMLLTGFGTDDSTGAEYWICENSWGEDWGVNGFIWMSRNRGNNCGIASIAAFPDVYIPPENI